MVRITHPFHPLFGREYGLVSYRNAWGEDRVYFHNEAGKLIGVPAHWTDFFPVDPFQVVAAGRSLFRPTELQLLVQLIAKLRSEADHPIAQGDTHERK